MFGLVAWARCLFGFFNWLFAHWLAHWPLCFSILPVFVGGMWFLVVVSLSLLARLEACWVGCASAGFL